MAKKRHTPEQVINKLRKAEVAIAEGRTVAEAARRIGVTEQTFYRWRSEYGGSQDRPGEAPEASGAGDQPPEASGGGPDAGQPNPEGAVWRKLLSNSRRRRCVDSAYNSVIGQPTKGRDDAPTSCPDHIGLGQKLPAVVATQLYLLRVIMSTEKDNRRGKESPPLANSTDHGERLARVEGAYEHLTTKADVERLRADLGQDIERVRSELKGVMWIIGVGITVAGAAGRL